MHRTYRFLELLVPFVGKFHNVRNEIAMEIQFRVVLSRAPSIRRTSIDWRDYIPGYHFYILLAGSREGSFPPAVVETDDMLLRLSFFVRLRCESQSDSSSCLCRIDFSAWSIRLLSELLWCYVTAYEKSIDAMYVYGEMYIFSSFGSDKNFALGRIPSLRAL